MIGRRVTLRVGEVEHPAIEPAEGSDERWLTVAIPCPTCDGKLALVRDGRIVALAGAGSLTQALAEFPGATVDRARPTGIRLLTDRRSVRILERSIEVPAECSRCRVVVGTVVVYPDTLFGLEEDDRVLRSRYRVY